MNVGAQLRRAREARGLSVAAVAAATRIQARVIEAIERNDLSLVPPRPYGRGFVAAYAREVGLAADDSVREFFSQFDQRPPVVARAPAPAVLASAEDRSRPWLPAAAVFAGIVLVGALLASRQPEPAERSDPAAVGTTGTVRAAGDPTMAVGAAQSRPTEAGPSSFSAGARAAADGVVVVLEPQAASWVAATVDGRRQLYQIVQPGAPHTLRGAREIAIRVGDAGAIRWSVNGRPAEPMGAAGAVRTVKVTAADGRLP